MYLHIQKVILNYGGVISTSKPDSMDPPHVPYASKIQSIVDDCLQYSELTNELYLQLIKATTEHPDPDRYKKRESERANLDDSNHITSRPILQLWKLMCVFTGCLLPDGEVLSYLRAHLRL